MATWMHAWVEAIGELYHLNGQRLEVWDQELPLQSQSPQFQARHQLLSDQLAAMAKRRDLCLEDTRLQSAQQKVLNSLKHHWSGLAVFLDHPQTPMDNNRAENSHRNPVTGRKNDYGSGAVWSAQLAAMLFSILQTLVLWGLNPQALAARFSDRLRGKRRPATAGLDALPALDPGRGAPRTLAPVPAGDAQGSTPRSERYLVKRYCGRAFSAQEIAQLRDWIAEDPTRTRADLSRLACQAWDWRKPDGGLKDMSCRVAMLRIEKDGLISLPPPRGPRPQARLSLRPETDPQAPLQAPVHTLPALQLGLVGDRADSRLWNEFIHRYHYLGYQTLPGAQLRYWVQAGNRLVALLGFGAAAWQCAPRDRFIGWSQGQRQQNLHRVVNNARFLILPWVDSKNLASKILGLVAKKLPEDWHHCYGYRPLLLETFVEKDRFTSACYRAANWLYVGQTQGRGKLGPSGKQSVPIKDIWLYPLEKRFRDRLVG